MENGEDQSVSTYGQKARQSISVGTKASAGAMSPRLPVVTKRTNAKTVYVDLPANASVFTFSEELIVSNGAIPIATAQYTTFTKSVPEGYVLYVKSFRVFIQNCSSVLNPLLTGVPNVNLLASLSNNGNVSPFNQDILVEPLGGFNPCYLIAGNNAKVQVSLKVDFTSLPIQPTDLQILTFIRGDVLARNNMPPEYTALQGDE